MGAGNVIRGSITVSNGFAVRLDALDAAVTAYYEYADGSLPLGVPRTATLCLYGKPKADCLKVTVTQRLEVAAALPEGYFEPYRHIAAGYVGITRSVAGRQVVVKDNAYAVSLARLKQVDRRTAGKRRAILWSLILISASFAGVIAYRRLKSAKRARPARDYTQAG